MKTKNCKLCNNFKIIYRKSHYIFWRCSIHYCTVLDKVIQSDEICTKWERRKPACDISEKRLSETEQDLIWIRDNV